MYLKNCTKNFFQHTLTSPQKFMYLIVVILEFVLFIAYYTTVRTVVTDHRVVKVTDFGSYIGRVRDLQTV